MPGERLCRFEKPHRCQNPVERRGLCVFHIPKLSAAEMVALPRTERLRTLETNQRFVRDFLELIDKLTADTDVEFFDFSRFQFPQINLRTTWFEKAASFEGCTFAEDAVFDSCAFLRGVSFMGAVFQGTASFDSVLVQYGRIASISSAFETPANEGAEEEAYPVKAIFDSVSFYGACSFREFVVSGEARFTYAKFNAGVTFHSACFEKPVTFSRATFGGSAIFVRTSFGDGVDFSRATIAGKFEVVHETRESGFGGPVNFRFVELGKDSIIRLDRVNLSQASFVDTDLESIRFGDVKWYRPPRGLLFPRREAALYDEHLALSAPSFETEERATWGDWSSYTRYEAIAANYRQLVNNYERRRDFQRADAFHIGEMEALRRTFPFTLNGFALYKVLSYYGTSYWYGLAVLSLMILAFSGLLFFTGFQLTDETDASLDPRVVHYDLSMNPESWPTAREILADYREALLFTLSIVTFSRERFYQPLDWKGRLILFMAVFALVSQLSLVLLAIRRRYRR